MKLTIYNGTHDRVLEMPGTISDNEWREKQKLTEDRYQARTAKSDVRRVEGVWEVLT